MDVDAGPGARVLPFRPNRGVLAVVLDDVTDHASLAAAVVGIPGVAGCWTFAATAPEHVPTGMPVAPAGSGFLLAWLDESPAQLAEPVLRALQGAETEPSDRAAPVRFAGFYRSLGPAAAA